MAKKSVAETPAPSLDEVPQDTTTGDDAPVPGDFGVISGESILRSMQAQGSTAEFAGGTLPLLEPADKNKKQGWLVMFLGKTLPKVSESKDGDKPKKEDGDEKGKFDFLTLEVFDHSKFNPKDRKTWAGASLGKAQMINSTTMRDYFGDVGAEAPKAKKGDILVITYNGLGEAKRGFSPPKLYSIYKLPVAAEK